MRLRTVSCVVFLFALQTAKAEQDLDQLMRRGDLKASVRARSAGAMLEESVAAEQAALQAKNDSGFGMELRPSISENDAGLALRINLPDRWSKDKLSEQLVLAAESEQLRVAALEWQELLAVYRDFCSYRKCREQLKLYAAELQNLEPYLAQADDRVQQHQLSVADRAKLYSLYLDLVNDREKVELERIDVSRRLHLALGSSANLDVFAQTAVVAAPAAMDLDVLVRQALGHRADYNRWNVEMRALGAAEAAARSKEGFHLKYIQPEYKVDFDGDQDQTVGISAAFVLPWGSRSPEVSAYQKQQALAVAAMDQQRLVMKERLQVLVNAASAFKEQTERRNQLVQPLLNQLGADLGELDDLPLEQLRDVLSIRERLLDTALQAVWAECEYECIAVDLAEEIGTFAN